MRKMLSQNLHINYFCLLCVTFALDMSHSPGPSHINGISFLSYFIFLLNFPFKLFVLGLLRYD